MTRKTEGKFFYKTEKMNTERFIEWVRSLPGDIAACKVIAATGARFGEWPAIDAKIVDALKKRGVDSLWSHQSSAISHAVAGRNVVIVTPTASGKTMCYNIPVIDAIVKDPTSRALYIFPTKALAQDQMSELKEVVEEIGVELRTSTYDGDTPMDARAKIRDAGHVVITNPDMLHTGILPHHTKWRSLFEQLKYIVIDELHAYRGVFGSHFSLILLRLKRICEFYGSSPTFICSSATIANPKELAKKLIGEEVELVDENGAPSCERHVLIYDPPIVNKELGIRRSALLECSRLAVEAIANGIRTIVFTRSRVNVEVLLTYIQTEAGKRGVCADRIAGYRGGYLPNERRAIERGLRDGSIHCVVSTNALELGIDIGSLELAILHGYPGSIASAWQQIGRSGRRASEGKPAAAIMVASSLNIDQFLAANPSFFFGASPEHARIDPKNPYIQIDHIKCAAFELPFFENEKFGECDIDDALDYLDRNKVVSCHDGRYFWREASFPAASISLRSATSENFVIHDITDPAHPVVLGLMDRRTAPTLIFPQAIYFHLGEPYQVQELDHEEMRCYVKKVDVDYYTDGDAASRIEVLDEFASQRSKNERWSSGWGEVLLASRPTIYKKIKLFTHENVGYGHIHLPEEQMHTTAFWMIMPRADREDEQHETLYGAVNIFRSIAPLFLMCDRSDLIVCGHEKDPHFMAPVIYAADNVPGGIGLAEALFDIAPDLIRSSLDVITRCRCDRGCPACVGAPLGSMDTKKDVRALLERLL